MWFDASGSLDVRATLARNSSCQGNANTKKRPSGCFLAWFDGFVREVEGKPYELVRRSVREGREGREGRDGHAKAGPAEGRARSGRRPGGGRRTAPAAAGPSPICHGLAPRAFSMPAMRSISDCCASTMPCASRFSTPTVHLATQLSAMWTPPL
ncbi:hypothetical protein QFZ66_006218 [Streptomyces sp. B4I13]|nr:hypothetical protein [Streptomyces sp. B4I13]